MPIRAPAATITGAKVYLRPPRLSDAATFLAAVRASVALHRGWTTAPRTASGYAKFVRRYASRGARRTHAGFLVFRRDDHALVGVYNFSEIVRGAFESAYLGYFAFSPLAGQGLMSEGLELVLDLAFSGLGLHRVEVNIQPNNVRSLALAERLGFTREGYSRRYVKIGGRWRDHVRFAMLGEDWRLLRRQRRAARKGKGNDR
jgi:[ribosomal protein S5]-alanine N-acetyltransferase